MKRIILWLALLFAASPLAAEGLVLAKFHADWCPSCKRWDNVSPGFSDLKRYAESKGITVVVFDLTDDEKTATARRQAERLGVLKAFDDQKNATGYALLIDSASGAIVQRLESGSANLFFFDSFFSEDAQRAFETNRQKIDAAVKR